MQPLLAPPMTSAPLSSTAGPGSGNWGGGGSLGVGWRPLAWERRPRPEAQAPWQAPRSCQDAGDSRPPVAPLSLLQLRGICCSPANAIRPFPVSALTPHVRPRVQPEGRATGPCTPQCQAAPRGSAPPRGHSSPADPQPVAAHGSPCSVGVPYSGAAPAGPVYCLLAPDSSHWTPPRLSPHPSPH